MFDMALVNPANKRKIRIIVVGTGLAGASASASLAELGYDVHTFTYHESREEHVLLLKAELMPQKIIVMTEIVSTIVCDTIKGGDFRARKSNVLIGENSVKIIDQCVAQRVHSHESMGTFRQSFIWWGSGFQNFYAKGQTGQQLLLGAYQAMMKEVHAGKVKLYERREMMDLVVIMKKQEELLPVI